MAKATDTTTTLFILLVVSVLSKNCNAFHATVPARTTTMRQQRIPFGIESSGCSSKFNNNNILKIRHNLKAVEDGNAEEEQQTSESSSSEGEQSTEISSSVTTLPRQAATASSNQSSNPMANNPLVQGEVTMDGSLIVLIPAAVIGIGGFILSIVVAMNSSDEIVQTLNASMESLEIKPRNEQSVDNSKCRGLCSSQQDDLKELQTFMQGLSGNRGGINAASVDIQTALDADMTSSTNTLSD